MRNLLYIRCSRHIIQWAYNSYGEPAEFPALGNENAVIRRFLCKPPTAVFSETEKEEQLEFFKKEARRTHKSFHDLSDPDYENRLWEKTPDCFLKIVIPDSKAKPADEYHYIGPRGRAAVREVITDLFKINLWSELKDVADRKTKLAILISAWCELHGIDIDYEDTVRQMFYRMRQQHAEKGVILNPPTRIKKNLQ